MEHSVQQDFHAYTAYANVGYHTNTVNGSYGNHLSTPNATYMNLTSPQQHQQQALPQQPDSISQQTCMQAAQNYQNMYNSYHTGTSTESGMSYPMARDADMMYQTKPEPAYDVNDHLSFAHLASMGQNSLNGQYPEVQYPQIGNMYNNTINFTNPPVSEKYRDTYESASPESQNSNSPPVVGYHYTDTPENSPPRPSFPPYSSPKNSPPRSGYYSGSPSDTYYSNGSPPSTVADGYVYPPTSTAYPIPQIKTERASPCSTPTPHHVDTHPYSRPASGSPRAARRLADSAAAAGGGGKLSGSPSGSPSATRRAHVLPPCKVCGVQATGFHYGVNTCEACKGFFRRSIIRKEEYVCLKSSKCIIEPGKRNLCGYCRYKKCLEAGMSVEGIKTGRYTYQKRTKDILELQQLKKEQSEARNQEAKRMKEMQANDLLSRINDVADRHRDVIYIHDALKYQQKYLEEKQLLTELFGKMERINSEDYIYALENLGLELDDRREIGNQVLEEMNIKIPGFFAAIKDLPGMEHVNHNDLISLFKHSYYDMWFVARSKMFNVTEGCFTTAGGITFDFASIFGKNASDTVQRVATRFSQYNLTPQEKILLVGVVFLSTDRVYLELEERETIDRVKEMYVEAMEICLPVNHPHVEHIFAKTLQMITDVRTVSQAVNNGLRAILKYTDAKKYPLLHDILTAR